ncbi:VOC family protein [Joostella atrarenae]|uniref:VOC family protein n=1 Tax=Joostella atrarenae TaxID=679257 RepID=A0ABS9J3N7_9FLAO|nr:VOC family protein [Joostella atrarenae]MCF8715043.1 VOC family protein [Joostella atrarenae]
MRKKFIAFVALLLTVQFGFSRSYEAPIPVAETYLQTNGGIVWYNLVTPNISESKAFYAKICKWTFKDINKKGQNISIISNNGKPIGSMIEIKNADASTWISSVKTNNIDASISSVKTNGGRVIIDKFTIGENIGKQVIVEGPLGEKMSFIQTDNPAMSLLENVEGKWIWEELWSTDIDKSINFYTKVLNLEVTLTKDDDRSYWIFNDSNDKKVAGMMNNPLKGANTQWVPYIKISDINGVYQTLQQTDAHIYIKPDMNVRQGTIVVFEDPNGATVCLQNYNN